MAHLHYRADGQLRKHVRVSYGVSLQQYMTGAGVNSQEVI